MNRGNYDQRAAAASLSLGDKANQRVRQILHEHQPDPLPQGVMAELNEMEEYWWTQVS